MGEVGGFREKEGGSAIAGISVAILRGRGFEEPRWQAI